MPLARYFFFVGAALLALLFVADEYLPKSPAVPRTTDAAADLSLIRIHSDRKWPERVVFDTAVPPVPPPTATADASTSAPPPVANVSVADVSARARVREVFAQLPPSNQLKPADPRKPEPRLHSKRRTLARSHVNPPPMMMVAQQPRIGFFGNNIW